MWLFWVNDSKRKYLNKCDLEIPCQNTSFHSYTLSVCCLFEQRERWRLVYISIGCPSWRIIPVLCLWESIHSVSFIAPKPEYHETKIRDFVLFLKNISLGGCSKSLRKSLMYVKYIIYCELSVISRYYRTTVYCSSFYVSFSSYKTDSDYIKYWVCSWVQTQWIWENRNPLSTRVCC